MEDRKQQFWKKGDVFISACPSSCLLKSDPLCEVAHHYISGIWSVEKLQNRYHGVHSHAYGLHFLKRRWYTTSMETSLVSGRWFQVLITGRRRSDTAPFCLGRQAWPFQPFSMARFFVCQPYMKWATNGDLDFHHISQYHHRSCPYHGKFWKKWILKTS